MDTLKNDGKILSLLESFIILPPCVQSWAIAVYTASFIFLDS
ncbi:Molybdenum transport system permease protein ModB [gamma proteobacterium IMCC2047]|nr:Molybdenum transport system permease protein ModB [gamma proteobacterium IMCC2047]